jgi:hypothetical protein
MDLDLLMAEADPARRADLPGADSPGAARLYRQITAHPPRRGGLPRPGRAAAAGLVVTAVTAALVALNLPAGHPGRSGPARPGRGSVSAILDAAAVAAGHGAGASRPPGPGQYLYVREIQAKGLGSGPQPGCGEAPMTVQAWVAADGSGRQAATFPARCAALDFDQSYPRGGLPWQIYGVVTAGTLPTTPAALQRAIVRRFEHGHSRPSATFVYAATFLNAGSSARLRAALYRVIESLPGVQNLGPATDRLGRHGQAVGLVTSGARDELIFDPASTVVLEEETVAAGPRQSGNNMLPPGTVMQYTVYLREGVVNSGSGLPRAVPGTPSPPASAVTASPPGTTPTPAAGG